MPIKSVGMFTIIGEMQIKPYEVSFMIKSLNAVEIGGLTLAISVLLIFSILPNIDGIK
jgi:hypothetical protein